MLGSYKLIVQQSSVLDVLESYAALLFVNNFDDLVGKFFRPYFKDYGETFMAFRESDFADEATAGNSLSRMARAFLFVTTMTWLATLAAMQIAY